MAQIEPKDWLEVKQFKDPVYGYIPLSRAYVKYLIDTQMMQRIKGVAQTGFRPVFSSATHDRFSHSLGVYKFAMAMYESFEGKLLDYVENVCFSRWKLQEKEKIRRELEKNLKHWKTLLSIGALLHDIGHPVQSHSFEFLYDDPYLDVNYDRNKQVVIGAKMDDEELERVYNKFQELSKNPDKTPEGNLKEALWGALGKDDEPYQSGSLPGNPHERMSAYYILKDGELRENIKKLIQASQEKYHLDSSQGIEEDLYFIARMIIGWEYPAEERLSFDEEAFFNSIRNCVIHILNGTIDADGLDYLMRNSYAAGYDTSKIDSTRLCNAYTVYEKNYVLFPAFSKSALSVLEGYMFARNFEPKWLYSHHKVVYADLLTKQLYKYITRYITDRVMLLRSVESFLECASKSALVQTGAQNFGSTFLFIADEKNPVGLSVKMLRSHMEQWSYPFYTYLLAPCKSYVICSHHFNQTADADFDALLHWMINELSQYKGIDPEKRYNAYTKRLKDHVVNSICNGQSNKITKDALRILLAENCLSMLKHPDEKVRDNLREWAEKGDKTKFDELNQQVKDMLSDQVKDMLSDTGEDDIDTKKKILERWLEPYEPLLSARDFTDFISLLDEHQNRRYHRSLWKSQPEYKVFLEGCARQLGVSIDDVQRYMEALIYDGMEEHGFSIFDGKTARKAPDSYREQFYYRAISPERQHEREQAKKIISARLKKESRGSDGFTKTPDAEKPGKQIALTWANKIFNNFDSLVIKFYQMKSKRFNNVRLVFDKGPVPLEEVFPNNKSDKVMFPYFYYKDDKDNPNSTPEKVLSSFRSQFIEFCGKYRESETRSETVKMGKNYVFRDVVYGDIEMPENFYAVVCTREFQRLGRIRQLATADRSFPNATHTRLAHSIGTWHVMRLILDHFKQLYTSNPQLNFSEEERNCALLAALLHDLGHGPYSHAIEGFFHLNHEEMTSKIIKDTDTEIHRAIENQFGPGTAERVCKLLNDSSSYGDGIGRIYHSVISGQLDADRIDYLLRDNAACGLAFGHIDIQQLITSMRMLPDYGGEKSATSYRLCFDDKYLPAIEQFIYARYQMYKNVYHDPQKMLYEQIFERIFRQATDLQNELKPDIVFSILKKIKAGQNIPISDYISLDDETVNALIKKWADGDILKDNSSNSEAAGRAEILKLLSQAFLYQKPLFERIDLGGQRRQYDLLAKRVGKQLDLDKVYTMCELDEACCAFVYIQGSDCAYKTYGNSEDQKKNIVLRDMADGTTADYAQKTLFRSADGSTQDTILETDYCYLYFSEELLRKDCFVRNRQETTTDAVRQIVESAKPRKHIEIEKKFYCEEEQLKKALKYLQKTYGEAKEEKKQTDTYYDCFDDVWVLADNHFSFRCREKDDNYIFTVKIPTDSPNYSSPSQFARYEYEFVSSKEDIDDETWQFLIDTLDICGKDKLCERLSKDQVKAQLVVNNQRVTYRLEGKCEICLDTVDYKTADREPVGDQKYQIEIELLAEPEAWPELEEEVITPLVKELGEAHLQYTNESKLETGLALLETRKNKSPG